MSSNRYAMESLGIPQAEALEKIALLEQTCRDGFFVNYEVRFRSDSPDGSLVNAYAWYQKKRELISA